MSITTVKSGNKQRQQIHLKLNFSFKSDWTNRNKISILTKLSQRTLNINVSVVLWSKIVSEGLPHVEYIQTT